MLKTIFAIIVIGIALNAGAAEPTPARVFATEGFVRSGLATKPSAADVAAAIAAAVGSSISASEKGAVNGVATLDAGGKVPTAQIPAISYNNLTNKPTIPSSNGVTSATSPSSCSAYSYANFASEGGVRGCSGGSVNGAAVSYFNVGAYCSSTAGQGDYNNPQVQTCGTGGGGGAGDSNCYPAPSAEATYGDAGAKSYCYCKIHSINGTAVVSSSRFVFGYNSANAGDASGCAYYCAYHCAYNARYTSGFRTALFSAVGA